MEGFLEASRVVEASLCKLSQVSKNSEVSLRKALLVSRTYMQAQDAAESVQNSLMSSNNCVSRGSSKLLATMKSTVSFEEDTAVTHFDLHIRSNQKQKHQPVSPIVLSTSQPTCDSKERDEDVMEFISHSVISDLLSEDDMDCSHVEKSASPPLTSGVTLSSASSGHWSQMMQVTADVRDTSPPLSPIKRQHNVAFPPLEAKSSFPLAQSQADDSKRFKFSSYDFAESLPGFCDHLSPKNLCSAPLITYMFGKGFGVPSNPMELDWPRSSSHTHQDSSLGCSTKLLPVLAY